MVLGRMCNVDACVFALALLPPSPVTTRFQRFCSVGTSCPGCSTLHSCGCCWRRSPIPMWYRRVSSRTARSNASSTRTSRRRPIGFVIPWPTTIPGRKGVETSAVFAARLVNVNHVEGGSLEPAELRCTGISTRPRPHLVTRREDVDRVST